MGQHGCKHPLCLVQSGGFKYTNQSSGDNFFVNAVGVTYKYPDMLLHYMEHGYKPPKEFVDDVMNNRIVDGRRSQTRSVGKVIEFGYLEPPFDFETSDDKLPEGFEDVLFELMKKYDHSGNVKMLLLANRDKNPSR